MHTEGEVMSRRVFTTAKDIWRKRAFWWTSHYEKREKAKSFPPTSATLTLKILEQMAEPKLCIDGSLDDWNYYAGRIIAPEDYMQLLKQAGTPSELFVKWYWSETEWQSFIRQFNNLPEPEPLYEIVLESEYPELKVVPYIMGITKGQDGYNLAVVPEKKQRKPR